MNTTERAIEKKTNLPTSSQEEGEMIQQLDLMTISGSIQRENLNSISLLRDSTKDLIWYAKRLGSPKRVADDDREILQETSAERVMMAAKCLDNARNMMKTKLEFLKFAKSMSE